MRRRIGLAILAVTVVAVALFAAPLGVAASRLFRDEAEERLAGEASRAAGAVSEEALTGQTPITLPAPLNADTRLAVYDGAGNRVAGAGPARSRLAPSVVSDGKEHDAVSNGELAVAVPIRVGRRDGAVLAAMPYDDVLVRTWTAWAGMAVLGVAVLGLAAALARRQAARIARPLEELTSAVRALGTGDFSVRAHRSGLREADQAGEAMEATARRLGDLLGRERSFSSDASHQIRTPLTALRLGLESTLLSPSADRDAAIVAALGRVDRIESIVEDLLARARDTFAPTEPVDLADVLERARVERWADLVRDRGRTLAVRVEPRLQPARASATVVHQVLDVLVMNALDHGAGEVLVVARGAADGLVVEVSDEGPGFDDSALRTAFVRNNPAAAGHGIGLGLARDLAEAVGGRLVVQRAAPAPVVALVLPGWREVDRGEAAPYSADDPR